MDDKEEIKKEETIKPDPETLHTTDPQEKMKGPVSDLAHGIEKIFDDSETKDEAEQSKKNKS